MGHRTARLGPANPGPANTCNRSRFRIGIANCKMQISNWQFAFSNLQLPGLWTTHQSSQESDTVSDILQALIARFSFDHDPAVIIILLQLADIAHPIEVAVAHGDLLDGPVGANSPCIVGVGVNQTTSQG